MNSNSNSSFPKINTFVFFDLETSDFIRGPKFPKITELGMIATSRDSIQMNHRDKLALPRVMHKLVLPINPQAPIHPEASLVSNLWNDNLQNVQPFNDAITDLILNFLKVLPEPICFVAHNGNRFDYPVFLKGLDQVNKHLPDSILCVDSLVAFQAHFSEKVEVEPTLSTMDLGFDEVDEKEMIAAADKIEYMVTNKLDIKSAIDEIDSIGKSIHESDIKIPCTPNIDYFRAQMQKNNEKTPQSQKIRSATRRPKYSPLRPENFKLETIYKHLINLEPDNAHTAEGDCLSMIRCLNQLGPHFAEWADVNAKSLNLWTNEPAARKR